MASVHLRFTSLQNKEAIDRLSEQNKLSKNQIINDLIKIALPIYEAKLNGTFLPEGKNTDLKTVHQSLASIEREQYVSELLNSSIYNMLEMLCLSQGVTFPNTKNIFELPEQLKEVKKIIIENK